VAILVAAVVAVILAIMFCVYLFSYRKAFYVKLRQTMSLISDSGTLKVLLLYLQTTSSLNNIWPDWALRYDTSLLSMIIFAAPRICALTRD
jgi:hypothetical protein